MNRFLLAGLFAVSALSGCTTCCHRAGDQALVPESCPAYTPDRRAKVYAILFRGFDPLHVSHVEKLREELNCHGFAKVYCVDLYHQSFVEDEIRRILCETPDARFVVVGYSLGAWTAETVAAGATQCGVPVDALIEIAPVYLPFTSPPADLSRVGRHLIIANGFPQPPLCRTRAEVLNLTGSGFFTMPSNPITVQMVCDALHAAADRVPATTYDAHPTLPLVDDPAPLPGQGVVIPGGT